MSVFTKEGVGALKFSYLVLVAAVSISSFLVVGSYLYWQAEKANNVKSQRSVRDAQARLATAKQERDDLRDSEDTYKALTARGVFVAERRLDFLEAMEQLKQRHQLISLEYNVGPQRPLKLAAGTTISAVDALGSRVQIKANALHDADLLSFLDEFSRMQRGLFPMDRCVFQRNQQRGTAALTSFIARQAGSASAPSIDSRAPASVTLAAGIEAQCYLEWITLRDKRSAVAASAAATNPAQPAKAR